MKEEKQYRESVIARKNGTFELRRSERQNGKPKTITVAYLGKCKDIESAYWHHVASAALPKQKDETVLAAKTRQEKAKHYAAVLGNRRTPADIAIAEAVRVQANKDSKLGQERLGAMSARRFAEGWSSLLNAAVPTFIGPMPAAPAVPPTVTETVLTAAFEKVKKQIFDNVLWQITGPILLPLQAEKRRIIAEKATKDAGRLAEVVKAAHKIKRQEELDNAIPSRTKADVQKEIDKNQTAIERALFEGHGPKKLEDLYTKHVLLFRELAAQ